LLGLGTGVLRFDGDFRGHKPPLKGHHKDDDGHRPQIIIILLNPNPIGNRNNGLNNGRRTKERQDRANEISG